MTPNSCLVVRASSVMYRRKTVFQTLSKKVVVEAPLNLMQDIVGLCDGTLSFEKIVDQLGTTWERSAVEALLQSMFDQGVLVDTLSLSEETWVTAENPMRFSTNISSEKVSELVQQAQERHRSDEGLCIYKPQTSILERSLKKRRSTRIFSGESVDLQSVVNMLWCAYGEFESTEGGVFHRTCPSAGALYPLLVHVVLFEKTGDMLPAVYKVCYDRSGGIGFKYQSEDTNRVARAFLNPGILNGTHGLIVLSGSLTLPGEKYGNRSLLYVPLEAGHATQNILLGSVEQNVATLEIGGFVDQLLVGAIDLPKGYRPLTTVAFGREGKASLADLLNSTHQVDWAVPMFGQYRPAFAIASVRVNSQRSWSHGRDSSPKTALVKATAEAKEWAACGSIPNLVSAKFAELDSAVDPRSVIKFHSAQYRVKGFPFAPFDESAEYAWTRGKDYVLGAEAYVLADHVYFPFFPITPYYCFSNSSGCAAHPDEQKAIETATLELIERDSFMIAYLSRITLPTIREATLPDDIQGRIASLRAIGFEVWVKDHSLDLAPVAMVFAQSEDMTYSKCASCASFDHRHAVSHALMEVEASVLSRLQNGQPKAIKPHEVGNPNDHGSLYGQKSYYQRADFLVRGGNVITFKDFGLHVAHTWQELLDRFARKDLQLLTVPLELSSKYGGNGNLSIVRSIVPGLVPMTFGYRQEPAGMERIYKVSEEFGNKKLSYVELTKFPHPFE